MRAVVETIFDNLNTWRHLPAYQLERRADIFFSVYLPEYLRYAKKFDVDTVIPEFPVRIGTIHDKIDINRSFKVDYVVTNRDLSRVLFVELKTDLSSRREKQDWYLDRAKEVGMTSLLEGILEIYNATSAKMKYLVLLDALVKAHLLTRDEQGRFAVASVQPNIEILYLQPTNDSADNTNTISFTQFAEFVASNDDDFSQRFANSLREWATIEPGFPPNS